MAFFRTPGIELLYSGVRNSTPRAAAIARLRRVTDSAGLPSSSWLYSGRPSIRSCPNENSDGANWPRAIASLRLQEARRRLPPATVLALWLIGAHACLGPAAIRP